MRDLEAQIRRTMRCHGVMAILRGRLPRSTVTSNGYARGERGQNTLVAGADFTATYMQIFYHTTSTIASQMAIEGDGTSMINIALEYSLTEPYVLDQMLALSALHCLTTAGAKRHLYAQEAIETQDRAPTRFNEARGRQSPTVGICSLLFVPLLGIHLLYDTVAVRHDSIGDFVSNFVAYMRIHRGVQDVARIHWLEIRQSSLDPLLNLTHWIGDSDVSHNGKETASLHALLTSTDIY